RDRKKHFDREKRIVRESIRASKQKKRTWVTTAPDAKESDAKATLGDTDSITRAHQNMVRGIPAASFGPSSSGSKLSTLSNSFSTDDYDYTSSYYSRSTLPSKSVVSQRPDPYAPSLGSSFQPMARKAPSSTQTSSVAESSATCSTCPSDLTNSTITEETASS
uniref:Nuclear transcription factor Y subunit n=1 Tax=Steinernema glaseri TaxID=37863 RepID=A0A1I7Y175_9BILA